MVLGGDVASVHGHSRYGVGTDSHEFPREKVLENQGQSGAHASVSTRAHRHVSRVRHAHVLCHLSAKELDQRGQSRRADQSETHQGWLQRE